MIYEPYPDQSEPIRQGDIFKNIPFFPIDPDDLNIINEENKFLAKKWSELDFAKTNRIVVTVKAVWGIVASQDCDAARDNEIAFFLIEEFSTLKLFTPPNDPQKALKEWARQLTRAAHIHEKWFYLPPDEKIGFPERMVAKFNTVIPVRLKYLLAHRAEMRTGRLNSVAHEHFREHIAQYYRRYPVNDWYVLNKDELIAHQSQSDETIPPYDWQK